MKVLPTRCPACADMLKVRRMVCRSCQTELEGLFALPALARLSPDEQRFVLDFVKSSGSLKQMARLMKLSYPTVRNRLDEIIERIKICESELSEAEG